MKLMYIKKIFKLYWWTIVWIHGLLELEATIVYVISSSMVILMGVCEFESWRYEIDIELAVSS